MESADNPLLPLIKSPKSITFPIDAMVMYSITSNLANGDGITPPPKTPLVELEQALN